jgi:cyanophycinase
MRGQAPRYVPALNLLPGIVVMPHFDRVADFAGAEAFRAILTAAPPDATLIGIDEDTALVRFPNAPWQVMGRQTVSVFDANGGRAIYRADETVPLVLPTATS